jgi:hypothetical protein
MKNLVRLAVAGALVAGYSTVQAQSLPSSDASDLWLFVADTSTQETFAIDTGVSVASLLSTSTSGLTTNPGPNPLVVSFSPSTVSSAALSSFINASGAGTVEWAIEGANYNSSIGTKPQKPGEIVGITDNGTSQGAVIAGLDNSNLTTWAAGFNGDIGYVAGAYTAGGATYAWSTGSAAGAAWGSSKYAPQGSTDLYGVSGADNSGIKIGSTESIFALTGGSSATFDESYLLGTVSLQAGGPNGWELVLTPVPLPAAVWLLGSGLLGLAGIARRRVGSA